MFISPLDGDVTNLNYSLCMSLLYARRHDYAFHISFDLTKEHNRSYANCSAGSMSAWNKIPLLQRLINDVDVIVWMDLDTLISDDSFAIGLDKFLPVHIHSQSECLPSSSADYLEGMYIPSKIGTGEGVVRADGKPTTRHMGTAVAHYSLDDMFGADTEPFLWVSQDLNPEYAVNLNTAVMAIRACPLALAFLQAVWEAGADPSYFKRSTSIHNPLYPVSANSCYRFDPMWYVKEPCSGYWGWPWEQGGIWGVLSDPARGRFRRGTCIRPHRGPFTLNTVKGYEPVRSISWYFEKDSEKRQSYDDVFAYHKTEIGSARFSLKRLLRRGALGHERIAKVCGLRVRAPRYGASPFT